MNVERREKSRKKEGRLRRKTEITEKGEGSLQKTKICRLKKKVKEKQRKGGKNFKKI